LKKFKKIYIEITNRCNLACSFCQPSSRPKAFMGLAPFEEILRKISGYTGHISLHVLGEPLLHPDLEHFLAVARAYDLQVNLSTNGTLLARNREMLLRQPALRQINISLHSFEEPDQEIALNSYMAGIFDFIARASSVASPLFINLRMWNLHQKAAPGSQDVSSLMLNHLENYFDLPASPPGDLPKTRGTILAPRVFLSRENRFTWPHEPGPDQGAHGYCRGLRDHIALLVDGTVVPCCLDAEADIPLGNIFQSTLPEILAAPRAAVIKEGFVQQRVLDPVCRRCTYRKRFQHNTPVKPVTLLAQ